MFEGNDPEIADTGVDGVGGGPMGMGMMEPVGGVMGPSTTTGTFPSGAWAGSLT